MLLLDRIGNFSPIPYTIGGIPIKVYNVESVTNHVKNHSGDEILINVLYLLHQRDGDSSYTDAIATHVLDHFTKNTSAPLIAVTFDLRNHGGRIVDSARNASWAEGNRSHAADMVSCIDGNVADLKNIVDFLPSYLNLESLVNTEDVSIRYSNIVSGYSMGAHTAIRFASRFPNHVTMINPTIGCSDMTSLLVNRLRGSSEFHKKWFYYTYSELGLSAEEKTLYPEALHNTISRDDTEVFERFPFSGVRMFASFYSDDPLVPSRISTSWADLYVLNNPDSEVYTEEGAVHNITPAMISNFAAYLVRHLK